MASITLYGTNSNYTFDPANASNCIGEGGMGRVFIGEQLETNRKVAIKVLFKEFTNQQSNIERFKIESTVKIKHQNLIEMIDFVEDNGRFHIISEFLEGEVLSDKIEQLKKNGKTFRLSVAKQIALAVADGLEELHKNTIIHRDIKPSNIMILSDGNVKLFDYGVIKKNGEGLSKLTRDGSFIGSYQYASPEQIQNIDRQAINESTDVYSLGITLYEMITGSVPFDGKSAYEIMDKQTKAALPTDSKLDKGYYNLIANSTAKNQKYRYENISQFRDDLLKLPFEQVYLISERWWNSKTANLIKAGILAALGLTPLFYRWGFSFWTIAAGLGFLIWIYQAIFHEKE